MTTYLEIIPFDVWDIHIVGWWADIFIFLPSKDVNTNQVDLCMNHKEKPNQIPGWRWYTLMWTDERSQSILLGQSLGELKMNHNQGKKYQSLKG